MHRALTIPELQHEIFQHVSKEDLGYSVSIVCKRWVDASVRIIWRTLYDLTPLLRLIGEIEREDLLTPENDFFYTCKFRSLHGDWTRFDFYNRHVRILYLGETVTNYQPALSAFAMLRPGTVFFPILQELEWRGYREDWMASVFMMHNSITAFSLWVEFGFSEEQVERYFDLIVARMPHLERFCISGMDIEDTLPFSRALELLIPRLIDLKCIQFPALNNNTFPIISATSSLSRITEIRIDDGPSNMPLLSSAPPCILPSRLEILHVTMAFRDVARLFHTALPHLSDVKLVSRQAEAPFTVSHLTRAISQSCRNLRKFHLDSAETQQGGQVVAGVADDCVTIADIAPLFACTAMKRFSIHHAYPLLLHDSDIQTLLTKWPALEILELNSFPSSSLAPGVSVPLPNWSTLALFARYGRYLFSLELYINGVGGVPNIRNSCPFVQLEDFRIGGSITTRDALAQARFLSYILPPSCAFFTPFMPAWKEIRRLVPEFQRVRAEEREAKSQLEREIIELRARLAS
ncbi:hypothetical protein ARMGADRAFT_1006525 [Armillaria gallica]|uniref:F-box domain-containing protein n=1 Tax=Armillaria gallica TaxID=47427 RepID=A0A2H3EMR9_ARMGA|nr:hypothetical protein ARMGADRAFT_1006525 [Armillaria gallica]